MNSKEIKELIEFLIEKDVTEFELERGDVKMRIKRGQEVHMVQAPMAPMMAAPVQTGVPMAAPVPVASAPAVGAPPAAAPAAAAEEGLHVVSHPSSGRTTRHLRQAHRHSSSRATRSRPDRCCASWKR